MQQLLSQKLADDLKRLTKEEVSRLLDREKDVHLAVILVGSHADSLRYISMKTQVAKEVGIILSLYHIEENASYQEVEKTVLFLNDDPEVDGIILQLPLPEQFSSEQTDQLLGLVNPIKDVDGLRGEWQTLSYSGLHLPDLLASRPYALPPMICAILSLLDYYQIEITGKKVVIVGKGRLVGTPLFSFFKKCGVEVTAVDEETPHILEITKQADLIISGTGEKDLITYQWIKEGAVVIDCAMDVHSDSVSQVAAALAPAKGGVGPLTIIWLLHNTLQSALNLEGGSHA